MYYKINFLIGFTRTSTVYMMMVVYIWTKNTDNIYYWMLLGILHTLIILTETTYAFIVPQNKIGDSIYFIFVLSKFISWIIFNGECIITHYASVNKDIKDIRDIRDVHEIMFFLSEEQMLMFISTVLIMVAINTIIIQRRSHILPNYILAIFLIIYTIYLLGIRNITYKPFYDYVMEKKEWMDILSYICILFSLGCIGYILNNL
jgi:hypothetical protein